ARPNAIPATCRPRRPRHENERGLTSNRQTGIDCRFLSCRGRAMRKNFKAGILMAVSSLLLGAQAAAATFVYVSNAEDGDIGMYTLQSDGSLQPGPRFTAEKLVMPMTVSPDKRFLIAAIRSKPFSAYTYSIDRGTGALRHVATGPLAANTPPVLQLKQGTGPRHLVLSSDNRFVYLLNELTGTVTTLALDGKTGLLSEASSASVLPPDSKLVPGMARGAVGTPGA